MKRYIKQLALFFTPLLLIATVVEIAVRNMGENTEHYYKDNYIMSNASKVEMLIIGNSHSYFGINPEFMSQGAFNAAIEARPLNVNADLLAGYIEELDSLQTVVLSLSYSVFRTPGFESQKHRYLHYTLYMTPEINCSALCKVAIFNRAFVEERFKNYKEDRGCDQLGFEGLQPKPNWQENFCKNGNHHNISRLNRVDENIGDLTDIIELCRERNVRLVTVTTPCHELYTSSMNAGQYEQMQQIITGLMQKYNFEYYNYIYDDRFEDTDFYDSDHLSAVGAEKFTKILMADMASEGGDVMAHY